MRPNPDEPEPNRKTVAGGKSKVASKKPATFNLPLATRPNFLAQKTRIRLGKY